MLGHCEFEQKDQAVEEDDEPCGNRRILPGNCVLYWNHALLGVSDQSQAGYRGESMRRAGADVKPWEGK
jgi:hypothetical protein